MPVNENKSSAVTDKPQDAIMPRVASLHYLNV